MTSEADVPDVDPVDDVDPTTTPRAASGPAPPAGPPRRGRVVLLVVAGGIAVFGVLAVGLLLSSGGDSTGSDELIRQIVAIHPPPGSSAVLRQESVGVTTEPGWECTLTIDGALIPEDEMEPSGGLNRCFFRPGAEKTVSAWSPGDHVVVISLVNVEDESQSLTERFTFRSA